MSRLSEASPDEARTKTKGSSMSRLEGKVAVVSGGNSGIGLAIARRFVTEGAYVFIFARRRDALDEAVQHIGANVTAIQADATRLEDLDRVAEAVRSAKGKVNVVVSNAALVEQVPLPEITEDHYDRTFDLNAKAPLFLVQKMLPMMGKGGSIILVASAMHTMGLANHSTYAAAKAAPRSYSRTWAAEFKDSGIRANALSPGVVDTPMLDSQATTPEEAAAIREGYANYTPMLSARTARGARQRRPLPRLGRELVHDGLRHGRGWRHQQRLTAAIHTDACRGSGLVGTNGN